MGEAMCLALPYRITTLLGSARALAEGPDGVRTLDISPVEGLRPGAYVLAAYGAALRTLGADEAAEILAVWKSLQSECRLNPGSQWPR
jgi:hydrogenase assembly chaperone HypC/HupF